MPRVEECGTFPSVWVVRAGGGINAALTLQG